MDNNLNNEIEDSIAGNMLYNFVKDMVKNDGMAKNIIEAIQRYDLTEKESILLYYEIANITNEYTDK
ncbi:hypothetical protein QI045_00535 [Staphylococcus saprophyticus]|nr:hypothetical protein [Staphylococcus saprophyticus]